MLQRKKFFELKQFFIRITTIITINIIVNKSYTLGIGTLNNPVIPNSEIAY